jgi:hypothetical protein
MNATGLKTAQPAFSGNILRALLATVVLAAIVTVLIVGATGSVRIGSPVAAPAPQTLSDGFVQFRADERAAQESMQRALANQALVELHAAQRAAAAASTGHPKWIAPDRGERPYGSRPVGSGNGATYGNSKQMPTR